ncbi:hypothetical protein D3C72_257570 [compost metagenome]
MTILIAATLSNCSILAADSRRLNVTQGTATEAVKIRQIAPNLVAAKFGYAGIEGDAIWEKIMALPPETFADITELLPQVSEIGRPIYEERSAWAHENGFGDYGYTLLLASFDDRNGPGIHYIDWKMDAGVPASYFTRLDGAKVIAQGPNGAQQTTHSAIERSIRLVGQQATVTVNRWVTEVVGWSAAVDPDRCALPAYVCVVDASGVSGPNRLTGHESSLDEVMVLL